MKHWWASKPVALTGFIAKYTCVFSRIYNRRNDRVTLNAPTDGGHKTSAQANSCKWKWLNISRWIIQRSLGTQINSLRWYYSKFAMYSQEGKVNIRPPMSCSRPGPARQSQEQSGTTGWREIEIKWPQSLQAIHLPFGLFKWKNLSPLQSLSTFLFLLVSIE